VLRPCRMDDKEYMALLRLHVERDKEILDRLAE
jgi:hypothetical protein